MTAVPPGTPASVDGAGGATGTGEHDSDHVLVERTARRVSIPRQDPADSFVLHAPLELLARTALLPLVATSSRAAARRRIADIATQVEAFGPAVADPPTITTHGPPEAAAALIAALADGDLDGIDATAARIGATLLPDQLTALLADAVIPSLAAAGHAPIFLWLLPRIAPRGGATVALIRPLARELGRHPTWRLGWFDAADIGAGGPQANSPGTDAEAMATALAAVPLLGEGPSNFIHPTMSRVDTAELAGALLGPVCGPGPVGPRGRAVLRVAAQCMLAEPPTHAPYGWSHALTMAQAVVGVAGACAQPHRALAVAATHVMGFRASLATRPPRVGRIEPGRLALAEALATGPDEAVAAAWHLDAARTGELVTELATRAAIHHDAHLAKYTLACLDAAAMDPGSSRLFLTAAAKLVGYWAAAATAGDT